MATTPRVRTRIGWHELVAPDVERAEVFYSELFRWTLRVWRPGTHDYAMIHSGGADHGGFLRQDVEPHWLVYVEVQDADEIAARAERHGGRLVAGPVELPRVGRYVVVADPEGAEIAAIAVEEPGPQPAGVFAWDELLAADPDAAAEFYGRVLGWTVDDGDFLAGGLPIAGLRHGAPAAWLSYLDVPDLAAAAASAEQLGARLLEREGRRAVLVDPLGARFGLLEAEERRAPVVSRAI
jgi:predicted enzyme related to lactoylglutathione lyase